MPLVTDYYAQLMRVIRVTFKNSDGAELTVERLSLDTRIEDILKNVSESLEIPMTHIRLHLSASDTDTPIAVKSSPDATVESVLQELESANELVFSPNEGITLFIEKTDIPVKDLDNMMRIRVILPDDTQQSLYIGSSDTVRSIAPKMPNVRQPIRLLEVQNHHVIRDYIEDEPIGSIASDSLVYVEESVDPLELDPPAGYNIVSLFHYHKDPSRPHSRPARILLIPGEPFSRTKERIIKRLGIDEKCTFAMVSYGRANVIEDSVVLASQKISVHDQIGVNHPDPISKHSMERSIKIRSSTPK